MNEEQRDLVTTRPMVLEAQARLAQPPDYGYPQTGMQPDEGTGLIEYWRMLRRRKGTLSVMALVGVLAAVLITLPQTPVYQAKTTVEMLEMNNNFMNMNNVQQVSEAGFNMMADVQTQIKILQSKSLTKRVVEEMTEKNPASAPADGPRKSEGRIGEWWRTLTADSGSTGDDARAAALKMAVKTLKARAAGQTKIIEVLVDSTDRQLAVEFANRLTAAYIQQGMEARWKMTERTGEFLSKQIEGMKVKLERSEDSLQNYARRAGMVLTGEKEKKNISEEKLSQLQTDLTRAQGERVQKQSRWEMAKTATVTSLPDVLNDKNLQEYQTKLTDLRRQKAEIEEDFTAGSPNVKRLDAQLAAVQTGLVQQKADIVARIQNEYDEAVRREKLLLSEYNLQTGVVTDQSEKAIQYGILKREVETNRSLYDTMLQKLKEASLASALRASNSRVVDPAEIPDKPYKPDLALNSALGLLGGLFFGVAFVVMGERANLTLQDPSDIGYFLNLPGLGLIPSEGSVEHKRHRYFRWHGAKDAPAAGLGEPEKTELALVTCQKRSSAMSESYRATLTSILFSSDNGRRPKTLVVTSAAPGDGKTTLVTNLAIAMAETGQRVLLIDADTRRPQAQNLFGLPNDEGLTTWLRGQRGQRDPGTGDAAGGQWRPDVHPTMVEGLQILTSGPGVAGPTNLLCSSAFPELLRRLEEEFDMIFIDTPPMLQIPDARVIGKLASGVVLVVRAGKTTRAAAMAARERLRDDRINVLGIVMNDWNPKNAPGGYYGYYDGYYGSYYGRYYGHKEKVQGM